MDPQVPLGEVVLRVPEPGGLGAVLARLDGAEHQVQTAVGQVALRAEPGMRHARVRVRARHPRGRRVEVGQGVVGASGIDAVGASRAQGRGVAVLDDPVSLGVLGDDLGDPVGRAVGAPVQDDGDDDRQVDLGGRRGDAGQTAGDLVLLVPGGHDDEDRGERRSVVGLVPRSHGGILTRCGDGRSSCWLKSRPASHRKQR